jgi:hypothetical protein
MKLRSYYTTIKPVEIDSPVSGVITFDDDVVLFRLNQASLNVFWTNRGVRATWQLYALSAPPPIEGGWIRLSESELATPFLQTELLSKDRNESVRMFTFLASYIIIHPLFADLDPEFRDYVLSCHHHVNDWIRIWHYDWFKNVVKTSSEPIPTHIPITLAYLRRNNKLNLRDRKTVMVFLKQNKLPKVYNWLQENLIRYDEVLRLVEKTKI